MKKFYCQHLSKQSIEEWHVRHVLQTLHQPMIIFPAASQTKYISEKRFHTEYDVRSEFDLLFSSKPKYFYHRGFKV